ncbi:MAG: hypothetical protein KC503_09585 [Myxococcales bacterium]|nr:hypothetical protein [Myxococcales bacterium]
MDSLVAPDETSGGSGRLRLPTYAVVIIALTAGWCFARIMMVDGPLGMNDRSRWSTVRALVENNTYAIGTPVRSGSHLVPLGIVSGPGWRTIDIVLHPERRLFYSSKPTLLPTLIAAQSKVLRALFGWTPRDNTAAVVRAALLTFNWLPLLLSLLLLARFAERYVASVRARAALLLVGCFASFVPSYVVVINNHLPAACASMAALYLLARLLVDGRDSASRVALLGLFCGLAAAVELTAGMLGACCLATLLSRARYRRRALAFVLAGALPAALQLLTNYIALGRLLPAYFSDAWYRFPGSFWARSNIGIERRGPRAAYAFNFIIGHHGVLSLSPILLLSGAGMALPRSSRRSPALAAWQRALAAAVNALAVGAAAYPPTPRALRVVLALIALGAALALLVPLDDDEDALALLRRMAATCSITLVCYFALGTRNYGGLTIGPRWLMWLWPLWLASMAPPLEQLVARPWGLALCALLFGASALSANVQPLDPWHHPWIYRLLR